MREPGGRHSPRSRLVAVEQTVNRGGGAVWPLDAIEEVARMAHRHGLAVHMDGARILNAVVASGIAAQRMAAPCDSVWLDLSKGLGCPVGGVLAGSRAFIDEAWRWKHRLGGALRQSGMLAAAGLYALDHNVERLAEDHANARRLADMLGNVAGHPHHESRGRDQYRLHRSVRRAAEARRTSSPRCCSTACAWARPMAA